MATRKPGLFRRLFSIPYTPDTAERGFLDRLSEQADDEITVKAAVLDARESRKYFGVPLAKRGIQPLWLEITSRSKNPYRVRLAAIDPNYFAPLEAAQLCHFLVVGRVLRYGLLALWFLGLLLLLPFKIIGAMRANRAMDKFFQDQSLGWGMLRRGETIRGFIYASLTEGTKHFTVKLLSRAGSKQFAFSIPVPGLKIDYLHRPIDINTEHFECTEEELAGRLRAMPRAAANRSGTREGDPMNLVVIGGFDDILAGFGASWDETEAITFKSCLRTTKAFLLGSPYPYSPVSSLYCFGRPQDFALQRARESINERLHLRLWLTPLTLRGKPVWVGQISRDIGVRFTWRTWNLTTHRIDPDTDDARDYVLDYLLESGRVEIVGYADGVGPCAEDAPRHNLTGDPYYTDGLRAVAVIATEPCEPAFLDWREDPQS